MKPLLLAACAALGACTSTGYYGQWQPKPLELTVNRPDGSQAALFSAAVLGQWRGEIDDGEIHVRLRIENLGDVPLEVPLERVEMLSGDLQPFGGARLVGGQAGDVAPGGSGTLDVGFAPPAEDPDLSGLQLRWVLVVEGREVPGSATFQRVEAYHAPYYPAVHVGVGWGFHSGWWGGGWCPGPSPSPTFQALPPHATSVPGKP